MDKVYKLPKIAFPEVSGDTVSFYSEYAGLPLKKCEVAFAATQSGTGDPSPENVRPIVGVDEITQTVNGVETVIDLDGTRYGGTVDLVSGLMRVTHNYATTYNRDLQIQQYDFQNRHGVSINQMLPTSVSRASGICNMSIVNNSKLWIGVNNITVYWIGILDELDMTLEEFKEWIVDHPLEIAYLMRSEHRFDIQLTPVQIETIAGTNTIFADTGDTTVQYIRVY